MNRQRRNPAPRLALLTSLAAAALLSACGGGDDGGSEAVPASEPGSTFSASQLQGRWVTASGITPARTGIFLPAAAGSTELWLLSADLRSLSRLQVSASGVDAVSATGKTYSLPNSAASPAQAASYSGSANLTNLSMSLNPGALQFTRNDALKAATNQADVAGNWRATLGGQTVALNWNIAATGALSGPSSTGCSYSGQLTARSDARAYNASLTETCNGASVSFSGIATYRANPAALTLALTSTDAAQAMVVSLTK